MRRTSSDTAFMAIPARPDTLWNVSSPLAAGSRVSGKFLLGRSLGQGGMGVVYEALDETLGRKVALKLILGEPSPRERARFEREARAAARVSSAHAVQIFETGTTENGLPYLAMELIDGRTLAELHEERRLEDAELLRAGAQVLDAL